MKNLETDKIWERKVRLYLYDGHALQVVWSGCVVVVLSIAYMLYIFMLANEKWIINGNIPNEEHSGRLIYCTY